MMNGDSCMMEKTFFADKSDFKQEANSNPKDETKNSSNPEIVLKEYFSEINNLIDNNNNNFNSGINNLSNSSNSRNIDADNICAEMGAPFLGNEKTWKYDVSQDSNQFDSAYSKLRKEKVRKSKNQNKIIEVIHIKNTHNHNINLNHEKYSLSCKPASKDLKSLDYRASPVITESDFNEDIEEFNELSLEKDAKNKISSINMKYNDINMIDNKNKAGAGHPGQYSYKKHLCITEPDSFIDPVLHTTFANGMHNRNLSNTVLPGANNKIFSGSSSGNNANNVNLNFTNLTPNKGNMPFGSYNLTPRNLNFPQHNYGIINNNLIFNNSGINQISHPNSFGNRMLFKANTGSFISHQSNYSSSNKVREHGCYENEESTEVGDYSHEDGPNSHRTTNSNSNTYQFPILNKNLSDRKLRVPTQESVESSNSANQYPFNLNTQLNQQNIYSNLCPQMQNNINKNTPNSGSNIVFNNDEIFPPNVNNEQQNFYLMTPSSLTHNMDTPFPLNPNPNPLVTPNISSATLREQYRQKLNRHTFSESNIQFQNNEPYKIILDDILYSRDQRTTLMIRNIPIRYNDEMLLKELEEFEGKFDCLYLPFDFMQNGNRGYAFINFVHPFHILLFYDKFEGKPWNLFESKKICELNYGRFQGINEIKRHSVRYKGSKKPLFFNPNHSEKIEIPKQYLNKLRQKNPNVQWEPGQYGGIKLIQI